MSCNRQTELTLVNGEQTNTVHCADRALAYGDGLFETIALLDCQPQHWSRHFARLQDGAARLYLECPAENVWLSDLQTLLAREVPPPRAVLKLLLSRGRGRRGYAPDPSEPPTRITQLFAWPASNEAPRSVVIECETKLARNPALAGIKHLNRLEQVLGAREVGLAKAQEGLMYDVEGNLIEGTRSNIFLVFKRQLWTPLLTHAGIAGVMRSVVLDHAGEAGFEVHQRTLSRQDLIRCEEVFFTNSLLGIQAVNAVYTGAHLRDLDTVLTDELRARLSIAQLVP
jgi:4-amino-4-deoxychorismate lyase